MKDRLVALQENLSLVFAVFLSLTAAILLAMITPENITTTPYNTTIILEEQGVTNFPAQNDNWNFITVTTYSLGTLGCLTTTVMAVFMRMAVNEVGDVLNVPILRNWLGWMTRFPILNGLVTFILMVIGFCFWLFSIYDVDEGRPIRYFWLFMFFFLLDAGGSLIYVFRLCSCVWLTLAQGEESLRKGRSKHSRTQSISADEIEMELDKYIKDAGLELIELSTFKTRLMIVHPGRTEHGEEDEVFVTLGQVTDRIAEALFDERVNEATEKAFNATCPAVRTA